MNNTNNGTDNGRHQAWYPSNGTLVDINGMPEFKGYHRPNARLELQERTGQAWRDALAMEFNDVYDKLTAARHMMTYPAAPLDNHRIFCDDAEHVQMAWGVYDVASMIRDAYACVQRMADIVGIENIEPI